MEFKPDKKSSDNERGEGGCGLLIEQKESNGVEEEEDPVAY